MRTFKLRKCSRVHGIHFAPDGSRLLAVGGAEARGVETAAWLDLATGKTVGRIDQYAGWYALPPDLSRLVLLEADQWTGIAPIQWIALPANDAWHGFPAPSRGKSSFPAIRDVSGMVFDATGERVAIGQSRTRGAGDEIIVARFDPPELFTRFPVGNVPHLIAFDAPAERVAITGGLAGDTAAEVYDVKTGKRLLRFEPPGTVTRSIAFLPDGRLVVANARRIYVLPPDSPTPQLELTGHTGQVNAVTLTPDGRRLLSASHDGQIRIWDMASGHMGPSFDWQIGSITALAFAPDGLTCAAAALKGQVVMWDVDA